MRQRKLIALLLASLSLAQPCAAGSSGADPLHFLFVDANARAVAMGGAYTALARDANAPFYNPAGLARIERNEATLSHNQYFRGITQEYIGLAAHQGWGIDLNYLTFGNVQRTTLVNPNGTGLGTTGLTDMALGGGYGLALGDCLSVGAGLKYIKETIDGLPVHALATDIGALLSVPQVHGLTLGLSLQNIGSPIKYQGTGRENLPLNARAGAAYAFDLLGHPNTLSLDLTKERSESLLVGVGVESIVAKVMAVRFGFNTRNDAGTAVTAGLGFKYNDNLSFDYALAPYGELGITHRLSVTARWGQPRKALP